MRIQSINLNRPFLKMPLQYKISFGEIDEFDDDFDYGKRKKVIMISSDDIQLGELEADRFIPINLPDNEDFVSEDTNTCFESRNCCKK